jgi:hypothetical protein
VTTPSAAAPTWEPGDVVMWRYRHPWHSFESVRPVRVVRDDADGLVAWLAPGTPVLRPVLADGRDLRAVPVEERFDYGRHGRANRLDRWRGPGVLKVAPAGRPWSVWVFRDGAGRLTGWYVNLESVHERGDLEVSTQDRVLDLVVHPDRTVERKDEDELASAVAAGRFTAAEAAAFAADAAEVEELVRSWASPFADGWEDWAPDPSWPVPEMPQRYAGRATYR